MEEPVGNQFAKRLVEANWSHEINEVKTYTATAPRILCTEDSQGRSPIEAGRSVHDNINVRTFEICRHDPAKFDTEQVQCTGLVPFLRVHQPCTACPRLCFGIPWYGFAVHVHPKGVSDAKVISHWDEIKEITNINLDLFLEMSKFCINCSYLQFKGQSYQ